MMTVIFGGASCGKSEIAENIAISQGERRRYIATMIPHTDDGKLRVEKHLQKRMGKGFETIECFFDVGNIDVENCDVILLECVGNLLANEMFERAPTDDNVVLKIVRGIKMLNSKVKNLVIVTNDVFKTAGNYDSESRKYIENFAKITRELFFISDTVFEVKCGIGIEIKGKKI